MHRGFTLIEVIVSLGIMVIVLPATTIFLLQLLEEQGTAQAELQMEQAASLILSELRTELTSASAVTISASTTGDDNGVLVFVDADGETVTIDRPTVGELRRLRFTRGVDPAVYLTSNDVDVAVWRVEAVREASANALTGIQLAVDFRLLNPAVTVYRQVDFVGQTTVALAPQTDEL